jgi:hypothetical protein
VRQCLYFCTRKASKLNTYEDELVLTLLVGLPQGREFAVEKHMHTLEHVSPIGALHVENALVAKELQQVRALLRQYLYFWASKASKLSISDRSPAR